MDSEPKFISVAIYDPDHPLFLVALKTKNVPGALGDIASRLGKAEINILSVNNYSLPDKPEAMISFFAQVKRPTMSEGEMRKLAMSSPFVLDNHIKKAESNFLVDDFTFPLMYFPSGRGVLFPQSGVVAMFQDIVRVYGSGGESILFRAGHSVGRQGAAELAKLFGEEEIIKRANVFEGLFAALGWSRVKTVEVKPDFSEYRLRFAESFECQGVKSTKPNCHFLRGLVAGSSERVFGRPVRCEEEKCAAMGGPFCMFRVTMREPRDVSRSESSGS